MESHSAQKSSDNKTRQLVITALMISLVVLGTLLFRVPIPMTQGYIHLGDTMICLGVILLGKRNASIAAGIGSAMADLLGGFSYWAPWSLVIKFAMAFTAGFIIEKRINNRNDSESRSLLYITALTAGGLVMCAGYLIAERLMYGSWAAAFIALPWNFGQFTAGIVLSLLISHAMPKLMH
jgi:uncharacterized membrane protein